MSAYAFGDSDLARERLGLVADTFAAPTRALLRDLPAGDRRYVLDLGCGPGYTTGAAARGVPARVRHGHRRVGGDGRRSARTGARTRGSSSAT